MNEDDRGIGTLGWVFLGVVLAAVIVCVLIFAPRGGKETDAPDVETPGEETSAGFLRVDDQSLDEWLSRAEPIGECEDGELLSNLSRGATARAQFAASFKNPQDALKWSRVAIPAYERLAELSEPGRGSPYRRISQLYLHMMNDPEHAIDYERRHIAWKEKGTGNPERLTLAKLLMGVKRYDEAREEFVRVASEDASDVNRATARMYIGDCFRDTGRLPEALGAYGRALESAGKALEASSPDAFSKMGTYLIRPGEPGHPIAPVSLIRQPPDSPDVRELVQEKGYKIVNERMRSARVEELKVLVQQTAEHYAAALLGMGPREAGEPASPAVASQPAQSNEPE